MGFLKKLFGSKDDETQAQEYVDKDGVYFYVQCDNCGTRLRVRADKQHDLLNEDGGYVWRKTIVDSKCFRRMQTVVYLDRNCNVTEYELSGGKFMSYAEYEAAEQAEAAAKVEEVTIEEEEVTSEE